MQNNINYLVETSIFFFHKSNLLIRNTWVTPKISVKWHSANLVSEISLERWIKKNISTISFIEWKKCIITDNILRNNKINFRN